MQEYKCQRIYRDARITSIYEGTTQLQTVAAIRYVTNGTYTSVINDMIAEVKANPAVAAYSNYVARIEAMAQKLEECIEYVKAQENQDVLDFSARKLYEMTAYTIMSLLVLQDTMRNAELFTKSLVIFVNHAESEVARHQNYIHCMNAEVLENYKQ